MTFGEPTEIFHTLVSSSYYFPVVLCCGRDRTMMRLYKQTWCHQHVLTYRWERKTWFWGSGITFLLWRKAKNKDTPGIVINLYQDARCVTEQGSLGSKWERCAHLLKPFSFQLPHPVSTTTPLATRDLQETSSRWGSLPQSPRVTHPLHPSFHPFSVQTTVGRNGVTLRWVSMSRADSLHISKDTFISKEMLFYSKGWLSNGGTWSQDLALWAQDWRVSLKTNS